MKTILVPVDFSKKSKYAAKMAGKIAKKTGGVVYLLHMIELPSGIVDMGAGSNFSIPKSMLYLKKVKEKINEFKTDFFDKSTEVHHSIRFQNAYEGISQFSDKIKADLIIMGSKGPSDFEEIIIGSNTEKVVRTSRVPVIVVKKDRNKFSFKNIVFASSFNSDDKKEVFKKILNFAEEFHSKIHLIKVITPYNFESTREARKRIKDFIKDFELPKKSINIYNDVTIEKGILNFSREIDADMICLSTSGISGLVHLFSSSVTKSLSKIAQKPILTIRV